MYSQNQCPVDENLEAGWRIALNKTKAAVNRIGFNFWDIYRPLDPDNTALLSESKFLSVLSGPLKSIIGLTEDDIGSILDYFRMFDGRVFYTLFCEYIHGDNSDIVETPGECSVNPIAVNQLIPTEQSRLYMILTMIAEFLRSKNYILKPIHQAYIPDYKKCGLISHTVFRQILRSMGIKLLNEDLRILVKRYRHDDRALRYKGFIREVNGTTKFLEDIGMFDSDGKLKSLFSEDVLNDEILNYIQPVGTPDDDKPREGGLERMYSGGFRWKTAPEEVLRAVKKIRSHVAKEKIRAGDYFKCFDPQEVGQISQEEFLTALEALSQTWRRQRTLLYLSPREISYFLRLYTDLRYPYKFLWKNFCKEIEEVFDEKELEQWPKMRQREICEDIQEQATLSRQRKEAEFIESSMTLEDVLTAIRNRVEQQGICLKPAAAKFDTNHDGHLTKDKFKLVFTNSYIYLSDRQLNILWDEYNDGNGLVYHSFFRDLKNIPYRSPEAIAGAQAEDEKQKMKDEVTKKFEEEMQHNIVEILADLKRKFNCLGIRGIDLFKPCDLSNTNLLSREDFQKALVSSKVDLSSAQLETIMDVFSHPENKDEIEYLLFCKRVDEDSVRPCLKAMSLQTALEASAQSKSVPPPEHPFVNFQERLAISVTCAKLCRIIGLASIDQFKAYDKEGTGSISKFDFLEVLHVLNANELISILEVDKLMKGFGVMRGLELRLDYVSLLNALDIVFRTQKAAQV